MRRGNPGLPERGAERWMPPRELAEVGVAGGARRLGGYGDPAPRSACACLEFVFSERARLGFPRPPFVAFGKTLEFPVLLGEGRGATGLEILSLRSEGWCSDRRPKHLRQRGPVSRGCARSGRGRSRPPGAAGGGGPGAREAGRRGSGRTARYFSRGLGSAGGWGSTPRGAGEENGDAAGGGARGGVRGCGPRARRREAPAEPAGSPPARSARRLRGPWRFLQLSKM